MSRNYPVKSYLDFSSMLLLQAKREKYINRKTILSGIADAERGKLIFQAMSSFPDGIRVHLNP